MCTSKWTAKDYFLIRRLPAIFLTKRRARLAERRKPLSVYNPERLASGFIAPERNWRFHAAFAYGLLGSLGAPGIGIVFWPPMADGELAGCGTTRPPNTGVFALVLGKPFGSRPTVPPMFPLDQPCSQCPYCVDSSAVETSSPSAGHLLFAK